MFNKTKEEKMDKLLKKFVGKLEDKNELDEKLKSDILELATTWNKEELMQDLIEKVEVHKSYDEENGAQFPYKSYIERFFESEGPRKEFGENSVRYEDVFHKGLQKGGKSPWPFGSRKRK